ncbi:hypothetical protein [Steroidobacter cummioxidans]|uniref:hypothetical protein n=1 Tax=Steroidobacter cummioxidans TaxID=1803913 RepID=UPI0012902582|nr:hypothetical protein [Steroidobacter cummioxidans]
MVTKKAFVVAAGLLVASNALAAKYCDERIESTILNANGNVYFKSASCHQNWCQVNWGDARNKNALALLLTAQTTEKVVRFYWPDLTSCAQQNIALASPESMEML